MISKRLEAVASFVRYNSFCLDIGCDHALLDIYLANKYKNIKLIASDINEKPLMQAKCNILKYHLTNRITLKRGDGLDALTKEVNTIIISGLGGKTMIDILNYKDRLTNIKQIVLSPNNNECLVKKSLLKLGFYLEKEILVIDNGIIYIILSFTRSFKRYTDKELKYGSISLTKDRFLYQKYIDNILNKYQIMLNSIPKKYIIKRFKIKKEIINIKSL